MTGPARKWEARRKLLAGREPRVRLDRCVVTAEKKGEYTVVLEGFGLLPAIVPPHVTVGGITLDEAAFEPGGRRVTGVLRSSPKDEHVVVDLGYARAEGDPGT